MLDRATPGTPAAGPRGGHRTRVLLLTVVSLAATLAISAWRPAAQKIASPTPVRMLAPGQQSAASPGEKGATYYSLEAQTTRFATRFLDGTTAVAERGVDGDVITTLGDGQGNELNRFTADRQDGINDVLQYVPAGGTPLLAQADPAVRITLDWANRQSHQLHKDRVTHDTRLEWKGRMMRAAGAAAADEDIDRDVDRVETQWANGLSARTTRVHPAPGARFNGVPIRGDVLVTTVLRDGAEIGIANYLTRERIYAWQFPGLTSGSVSNENLKARHGGWPFKPDMVWMNLQALGLHHWKTTINEKGFVAQNKGCGEAGTPSVAQRLLRFVMPVVQANEPGCDGLHWLDGTILRYCCDSHDKCYEKYGCGSSSWWRVWTSWQCDYCNMAVTWCFLAGGDEGPFVHSPY